MHSSSHAGHAAVVSVEPFDEQGVAVVVDGDLDLATAPELAAAIRGATAGGHRHFVIDLTAATFLDSTAMGTLVTSLRPLRDDPAAAVVLVGANGIVERSLEISGIGRMFTHFDSRVAAIDGIQKSTEPLQELWRSVPKRSDAASAPTVP